MKKIAYSSILLPLTYSSITFYRAHSLADALIILGFCGLSGFLFHLNSKISVGGGDSEEVKKLEYQIRVKQLEDSLANVKFQSAQQQSRRDEMASAGKRENIFGL